jgi:hypothetical protein
MRLPFTRWQRRTLYAMVLAMALWGLWDVFRFAFEMKGDPWYPMPFLAFTLNIYVAADLFVAVALGCMIAMVFDR